MRQKKTELLLISNVVDTYRKYSAAELKTPGATKETE